MTVLFGPTPASAAARWYVKPGGTGDGTSWAKASADLAAVLNKAGRDDEIWVAAGTYRPTEQIDSTFARSSSFDVSDKRLYGGFRGTETSREQRDPARNRTILTGDLGGDDVVAFLGGVVMGVEIKGHNSYHVVRSRIGSCCVLDGFTILGGNADCYDLHSMGGGMYNESSRSTVRNCSFIGNRAAKHGGGIYDRGRNCTVTNCTFCANEAGLQGGGMYNLSRGSTVTNCTFCANKAGYMAGGMFSLVNKVMNCTFCDNRAVEGAGISLAGLDSVLRNCILWDAEGCESEIEDGDGGLCVTHCVVRGGYERGTDIITESPRFGFYDFRGPTWTRSILPGSPAIDAGTADGAPLTDQRGVARPQGSGVDIGAWELESNSAVTPSTGGGDALDALREGSASADLPAGMSAGDLSLVASADLEGLWLEELETGDAADAVESAEPDGKFLCGVSFDVTASHDAYTDILPAGLQLVLSKDRFSSRRSFNAIAEDEEEVGLAEAVLNHVTVLKAVGGETFDLVDVVRSADCDPRDFFSVSRDESGNILVGLGLLVADAPAGEVQAVQAVPASGDCRFLIFDGAEDGHYRDPLVAVEKEGAVGSGGCNALPLSGLGLLLLPLLVLMRK